MGRGGAGGVVVVLGAVTGTEWPGLLPTESACIRGKQRDQDTSLDPHGDGAVPDAWGPSYFHIGFAVHGLSHHARKNALDIRFSWSMPLLFASPP